MPRATRPPAKPKTTQAPSPAAPPWADPGLSDEELKAAAAAALDDDDDEAAPAAPAAPAARKDDPRLIAPTEGEPIVFYADEVGSIGVMYRDRAEAERMFTAHSTMLKQPTRRGIDLVGQNGERITMRPLRVMLPK